MSLRVHSKFNIPGIPLIWNASTWLSRWDRPMWTIFQTTLWQQAGFNTKTILMSSRLLKFVKLLQRFKISPILPDLCHISYTSSQIQKQLRNFYGWGLIWFQGTACVQFPPALYCSRGEHSLWIMDLIKFYLNNCMHLIYI